MPENYPTPLQAAFQLTRQEKHCMIVLCALMLLGIVARFYYLKNQPADVHTPAGIQEMEPPEGLPFGSGSLR